LYVINLVDHCCCSRVTFCIEPNTDVHVRRV